jgi:hypothetical protein
LNPIQPGNDIAAIHTHKFPIEKAAARRTGLVIKTMLTCRKEHCNGQNIAFQHMSLIIFSPHYLLSKPPDS